MPDRYIMYRERYKQRARAWRRLFHRLCPSSREEFLDLLHKLHVSKNRPYDLASSRQFRGLLEHYYPGGKSVSFDNLDAVPVPSRQRACHIARA